MKMPIIWNKPLPAKVNQSRLPRHCSGPACSQPTSQLPTVPPTEWTDPLPQHTAATV